MDDPLLILAAAGLILIEGLGVITLIRRQSRAFRVPVVVDLSPPHGAPYLQTYDSGDGVRFFS
jgi:hypothetical protein